MGKGRTGERAIDHRGSKFTSAADKQGDVLESWAQRPTCIGIRSRCSLANDEESVCADCRFLYEQQFGNVADAEFMRRCRAIRDYVDQGTRAHFSPYVAAVLVRANGFVLDIDERSAEYLGSSHVLGIRHNRLFAHDKDVHDNLVSSIARVSVDCNPETIICSVDGIFSTRYAILLQPSSGNTFSTQEAVQSVACFIFPLGRRRIASARQLISMFGLSPAEARLARALCHGETLEEYSKAENLKLPTVKSQLRAIFAKTQTERQVTLVNLISGIPALR